MYSIANLSKFIAYILRHNPSGVGIQLDKNGWANVAELIDGINKSGRKIDKTTLIQVVTEDEKMRFSFNADASKIRANQGHSIDVDIELDESSPPDTLYHGTATKYLNSIKQFGIQKRTRNYVHLSIDEYKAIKVGLRHGDPIVLTINSAAMYKDGYKFYLSANGVWLTDYVPVKYITNL